APCDAPRADRRTPSRRPLDRCRHARGSRRAGAALPHAARRALSYVHSCGCRHAPHVRSTHRLRVQLPSHAVSDGPLRARPDDGEENTMRVLPVVAMVAWLWAGLALAAPSRASVDSAAAFARAPDQAIDETYTRLIGEFTTDPTLNSP